jgi:hypothetical protein
LPEKAMKKHKNLSQDSWSLAQVLNIGPPEYEAGVPNRSNTKFSHRVEGNDVQNGSAHHWK